MVVLQLVGFPNHYNGCYHLDGHSMGDEGGSVDRQQGGCQTDAV